MSTANEQTYTLGDIVARFGGELLGDAQVRVSQVASLEKAQACHISFFTASRFQKQLDATAAGAVIVGVEARDATPKPRIVSSNPYAYFAKVSTLLNPAPADCSGIHPTAQVEEGAVVAPTASIGPFVQHRTRREDRRTGRDRCRLRDWREQPKSAPIAGFIPAWWFTTSASSVSG